VGRGDQLWPAALKLTSDLVRPKSDPRMSCAESSYPSSFAYCFFQAQRGALALRRLLLRGLVRTLARRRSLQQSLFPIESMRRSVSLAYPFIHVAWLRRTACRRPCAGCTLCAWDLASCRRPNGALAGSTRRLMHRSPGFCLGAATPRLAVRKVPGSSSLEKGAKD
jgi:hypothetical protein